MRKVPPIKSINYIFAERQVAPNLATFCTTSRRAQKRPKRRKGLDNADSEGPGHVVGALAKPEMIA